ncbi:TetR/AcrR family transcriptional regulator [Cohnella sp. REN36]|uniref:TetR/AcrR family transcriptional regulator n=1 Tax=Cohnella sp. REN36 TaxID=2887347 RepID=UPI001D143E43|nr:TetR/AcrR family transcriptional regulator [Cohnella sp. REN36]MCC3374369.1 TetR/AcrR family transcriptional regulator [Cohnella sp. REN36]
MSTNRKLKWLEEGFSLLGERGAGFLTIDTLTSRLGVTKGSFYHHFQNWQNYKENLLSLYENERTLKTINMAEQQLSPLEKFELVMKTSLERRFELDVAIRAWALLDPFVASYQLRIDEKRLEYLEEILWQHCQNRERSRDMARLFYSLHVGGQHLFPPVQGQDLEKLYREIQKLL